MDAICFKNVTFEYDAGTPVICGISVNITEGEFVSVIGHNGSGKSTFAKLCNGILEPAGGEVLVFGMNTCDDDSMIEIRKKAGMVFQNPDNQIVATSVEEDTAFAPENLGVPSEEIRVRVDRALEQVKMKKYADRQPHKLSGGQKQRVAIAGILAMQPRCIILDEPTAMLDPSGRREVMAVVRELNRSGITIILVTHFMEEAAMAERVIVLDRGSVFADAPPRKVFSDPAALRALGLDVPPATELAQLLEKNGMTFSETQLFSEELADSIAEILNKDRK